MSVIVSAFQPTRCRTHTVRENREGRVRDSSSRKVCCCACCQRRSQERNSSVAQNVPDEAGNEPEKGGRWREGERRGNSIFPSLEFSSSCKTPCIAPLYTLHSYDAAHTFRSSFRPTHTTYISIWRKFYSTTTSRMHGSGKRSKHWDISVHVSSEMKREKSFFLFFLFLNNFKTCLR